MSAHRRPKPTVEEPSAPALDAPAPRADWLGHLVERRRREGFVDDVRVHHDDRDRADDEVVDLLREHLAPDVFVEKTVRDFLDRYGPFDPIRAGAALHDVVGEGRVDHHVSVYLEAIREALR